MEETLHFRVNAWWASGRTGIANCDSAANALHFTSPPAFGGLEGRWTPEDLLLCALASCFTTTFRAVAEHSKFEFSDLEVEAEGEIKKGASGYEFSDIVVRANLTISSQQEAERGIKLMHKAEALCMVSRALSLKPRFMPHVQVTEKRAENSHALQVPDTQGGP